MKLGVRMTAAEHTVESLSAVALATVFPLAKGFPPSAESKKWAQRWMRRAATLRRQSRISDEVAINAGMLQVTIPKPSITGVQMEGESVSQTPEL